MNKEGRGGQVATGVMFHPPSFATNTPMNLYSKTHYLFPTLISNNSQHSSSPNASDFSILTSSNSYTFNPRAHFAPVQLTETLTASSHILSMRGTPLLITQQSILLPFVAPVPVRPSSRLQHTFNSFMASSKSMRRKSSWAYNSRVAKPLLKCG